MSLIIFGVTFFRDKKVIYALPQLYGIGKSSAYQICSHLGISPQQTIKELTDKQEFSIIKMIKENFVVEGNLEEQKKLSIQFYQKNGSIRGQRLRSGLPVRGQRTHSNAKTARRRLHLRLILRWMVEWFKTPVLKTGVSLFDTMGSNPIPSVFFYKIYINEIYTLS